MKKFGLILALLLVTFASSNTLRPMYFEFPQESDEVVEVTYNTYEMASLITGCPVEILYGIAFAESTGNQFAIGDDGISKGRFQINEKFHAYYAALYGEYDPFCPLESAILTGRIYLDNLKALGNVEDAIAAHRQGRTGVRRSGRTQWYVDRVLNYQTVKVV